MSAILALNAGSSSLKFAAFELGSDDLRPVLRGALTGLNGAAARLEATGPELSVDEIWPHGDGADWDVGLANLLVRLEGQWLKGRSLRAIGHRVVHGGADFDRAQKVTPATFSTLQALSHLAPLHQPHNLAALAACARARPDLPQSASFDTAFHRGHAPVIDRIALPRIWSDRGVRRYGFHGLSYRYVVDRLGVIAPALAPRKLIIAHLGSGASLCAVEGARSIDTTMGFSALDGLVMSTRTGAVDPGVLLHLLSAEGLSVAELTDLLHRKSGLLGVSGISADMRDLLASPAPEAREAIELFCHRAAREASALAGVLQGLDGVVFTAGVGEHAPAIRAEICARLSWLGLALDPDANAAVLEGPIHARRSRIEAWVVPTDEERVIAREAVEALGL